MGLSQAALAQNVGVSQPLITKLEKGQITNTAHLGAIILALGLEKSEFPEAAFHDVAARGVVKNIVKRELPEFARDPAYWAIAAGLIGEVPLYASAEGGDGALIIERDPIGTARRPPELQGVKDGYAIYLVGESMIPEFEPGDTLFVNPRLAPISQTTCVFYNTNADDPQALVKRYLGESPDEYRVMQHHPHKVFNLQKAEWGTRHRVIARYMR